MTGKKYLDHEDSGKQETGKQKAGKQESGKQETGKQEAEKQEAGKQEADGKAEVSLENKDSARNRNSVGMHDFLWCLRKSGWIFLVGLVIFLLLIPFSTAGLPGDSIFNIEVTHEQMKFRLFHEDAIMAIIGAALGLGLCAGLSLFHFVQEKKETTIYFSLGITRTRLFLNRALAGILLLAGSIALPMAVSLGLNLNALGNYQGLISSCLYLTGGILVISLVSFFVTAAVSFTAGTLTEAVVYWAGILCGPTVLCYGAGLLLKELYWGNPWGVITWSGVEEILPSLLETFDFLNPILFFQGELENHGQFVRPLSSAVPEAISGGILVGWSVVCFLLAVCAWYLLCRRKAETAGIAGTCRPLSEYIIALTGFLAFSLSFSFLYEFHAGLAAGLGLLAFLAVHLFWRKTLFAYEFRWRRGMASIGVQGIVIAGICLVFSTGFFGSTERFLENSKVVEATFTYVGSPALLYGEASGSSTGTGYYIMSQLTVTEEETMERLKDLQMLFVASGKQKMESPGGAGQTVIPYDICFSYTDEKGKEHVWYYDRASFANLEQMLSLEDCAEVKEKQRSLLTGDGDEETDGVVWAKSAYANGNVYLTDPYLSTTYELTMSEDDRESLLEALALDLSEMTLEELYFPQETACAVLMFSENGEQDCKYFTYHLDNSFLYLTPSWEHTLTWLEENGLLEMVDQEPEVEYIYLQKFDPYIGINDISYPMGLYFMAYCADSDDEFLIQKDFGTKYTVTDADEIAQLTAVLQDGCYMSRGGYLAAVKLKGKDMYRYLFLPADSAPDFIRW